MLATAFLLVAASPASAIKYLGTTGSPYTQIFFKAQLKSEKDSLLDWEVFEAEYSCDDGSRFYSNYAFDFVRVDDDRRFKFRQSQGFDPGGLDSPYDATLRVAGRFTADGQAAAGTYKETRDLDFGGTCSTGKVAWTAAKAK